MLMFTAILLLVVVLSSGDAMVAMIWVGGWRALVSTIVGCHWRGCTKIVVEGLLCYASGAMLQHKLPPLSWIGWGDKWRRRRRPLGGSC